MIKFKSDKLREECGVFGVSNTEDAATLVALGLHALQHRGQESAGIVTFDGQNFNNEPYLGLVGDHFTKSSVIDKLPGKSALHLVDPLLSVNSLENLLSFIPLVIKIVSLLFEIPETPERPFGKINNCE